MTVTSEAPSRTTIDDSSTKAATATRDEWQPARRPRRLAGALLAAGACYLAASVAVWSHVWFGHPSSTSTCGCGDSSLFTWFLAWPAHAIAHGLDPWYTASLGHPSGVNLLANTSVLAVGTVLAPVTWLFGPIVTLNVALTLAPFLSALAMFVLVRRWVRWAPAAFVAGLLYGFSPFVLVSLVDAHLMLGMAFVPPLVVACLDELLFRHPERPAAVGALLGVLLVLQFFLGTELLALTAVVVGCGLVVLGVSAAARRRRPDPVGTRRAATGLAVGGVVACCLLALPAWFALAGPAHFSGLVWPGARLASAGTTEGAFFLPSPPLSTGFFGPVMARVIGGTQGPVLSFQYLGIGAVLVAAVGLILWRRDRRLRFFGAMAVVTAVLSLGAKAGQPLPWHAFASLPLLQNVTPSRFVLFTVLAVAAMLGIVVDHCHDAVVARGRRWRAPALVAGAAVAAVALVPVGTYVGRSLPIATQPVVVPTWFRTVSPHVAADQVVLVLPAPFAITQSAMTWQALDGMQYSMVGQGGPGGVLARAGADGPGQAAIVDTTFHFGPVPRLAAQDVVSVRAALRAWGTTMIVVPDQPALPDYERIRSVPVAAALLTAATGVRPSHEADAWVWTGVQRRLPVADMTTAQLQACTDGLAPWGAGAVEHAVGCVSLVLGA